MVVKETKINNCSVKPLIPITTLDTNKIKGGKLIDVVSNITLLCAKRNSGKTTAVAKLALETTSKKTIFWIFTPTYNRDDTWIELIKRLKNRGNTVNVFGSIFENKKDILYQIVKSLLADEEDEPAPLTKKPQIMGNPLQMMGRPMRNHFGLPEKPKPEPKPKEPKVYKPKKEAPEHIFIIDDLATQLSRSVGVEEICKNGRHLKMSIYISFQYKNDLPPGCWTQATYLMIFQHISREKLKEMYLILNLHNCTLEQFYELYDYATTPTGSDKKPFLYIDVNNSSFKKSFNKRIELERGHVEELE